MRSNQGRDAVTLNIVMSLLIFAGVIAVGAVPMVLLGQFIDDSSLFVVMGYAVVAGAFVVALRYLWRHRTP